MDKGHFHLITAEHKRLAVLRGVDRTYCPSEVARNLFPDDWRMYMDDVREIADQLIKERFLVLMQRGIVINDLASKAKGPIRLRKSMNPEGQ